MLSHRTDSKRSITWRGDLLRGELFESAYSAARDDVLPLVVSLGFAADLPIDTQDDLPWPAELLPESNGAVGADVGNLSIEHVGIASDPRNECSMWVPTEYRICRSPEGQSADDSEDGRSEEEGQRVEEGRVTSSTDKIGRDDVQAVPFRPLATWPQLRTRLQPLLQRSVQTRRIDEKVLVEKLCRCESLTELPRRLRKRGPHGLLVLEDRSERCIPFLADERFVKERLQCELAVDQVRFVSGDSRDLIEGRDVSGRALQHARSQIHSEGRYDSDPPATVLILGDVGVLERDDSDIVELWVQCCERWRQSGVSVFALVPFAMERMPRAFRGLVTPIAWQGNAPTGCDDLMREEILHEIFVRTYPAMRLEPALLRELRVMVPEATDASLESEVWQHDWLASNHIVAARHDRREVKDKLRESFEQLSDETKRRILNIQRRFRMTTGYHATWLAELVNLSPETRELIADHPDDEAAMQQMIWEYAYFVKRQSVPKEERDRMDWFSKSASEVALQDPVVGEAVRLLQRAFRHEGALHHATRLKEYPSDKVTRSLTLAGLPNRITASRDTQSLSNPPGAGLQVTLPSTKRGIEVHVPTAGIAITSEEAFWKTGRKPIWVSDYGTDRYGAWCEFQVPRHKGEGMVTQRLRWIQPGEFMMGSPETEEGRWNAEGPQHPVKLTQGYWLAETPVTQVLWMAISDGENPSKFQGASQPVERVSWDACQAWLGKLRKHHESLQASFPSEAQWEYACRAGSNTAYCFGDDPKELSKYAWFDGNSKRITHPVKQLEPNGWGLHDMHGNVWEWCSDWLGDYPSKLETDPTGPTQGSGRVIRGGCWSYHARGVRSACRFASHPGYGYDHLGFRLLSSAVGAEPSEGATTPVAEPGVERARLGSAEPEYTFLRSFDLDGLDARELRDGFAELDFGSLRSVRVISDRAGYQFDRITKPAWAVEFGSDEYGLYATFEIEPVERSETKKSRTKRQSAMTAPVRQRLRWIPPGRFVMGSPVGEAGRDEEGEVQHAVNITHGYWIFDTPCTQSLWECVMGSNPSHFVDPASPVERVSWEDVSAFVSRLRERFPKELRLRLPTEAEWEYACRAGSITATYAGDLEILGDANAPVLDDIAWYGGNSGHEYDLKQSMNPTWLKDRQYPGTRGGTRKVGTKSRNAWGLYDTLGNVWEWCWDWKGAYDLSEQTDPIGPAQGSVRVFRGGSWDGHARGVRSACRGAFHPGGRLGLLGFRLLSSAFEPSAGTS